MIFIIEHWSLFLIRIRYKLPKKSLKLTLNLLIWYLFWTNAVWIQMIYSTMLYIFFDFKVRDEIFSNRYAFCFIILCSSIFFSIAPYIIMQMVEEFAKQILFGESKVSYITKVFTEETKTNFKSRSFYLLWIFRFYIWAILYISFVIAPVEVIVYGVLIWTIIWLPILWYTLPFRDGLLNFAAILNHTVLCFMYLAFLGNALTNSTVDFDYLYFNDFLITAFALGICSLGSFLVIYFKITLYVATPIVRFLYPYFKAFYIKTIGKMKEFRRWLRKWSRENLRNWAIWRRFIRGICYGIKTIFIGWRNKTSQWITRCWRFRRN